MSSKDKLRTRKPRPPVEDTRSLTELNHAVSEQLEHLSTLTRQVQELLNEQGRTKSSLKKLERLLPMMERDLRMGLDEVHDVLARRDFFPPKEAAYKQIVRRLREILRTKVPPGCRVAFVGKPDRH